MKIKKITGIIEGIINLSETAKEIELSLSESIHFMPGSFVNVFMDIKGEKIRRAYSIVSTSLDHHHISIAVRLNPRGTMTPLFWNNEMIGKKIEIMGPLGFNTADKMKHSKIYLFAFGIGAGVVKSLADYFSKQNHIKQLSIVTGSKYENEILYRKYFEDLADSLPYIKTMHIISRGPQNTNISKGYVQNYIDTFDFNNADVYVCGQESACNALVEKIQEMKPEDCNFFIEGFH